MAKTIKINFYLLLFLSLSLVAPKPALATIGAPWDTSCLRAGDVATISCLTFIVTNIISAIFAFIGLLLLVLLLVTALRYVTSTGNSKNLQQIQQSVSAIVIGMIVMFLAFFIIRLIAHLTGVQDILNLQIGP